MSTTERLDGPRHRPEIPQTPFCVVSAMADRAPSGSLCALGKPVDLDRLLQIVRDYCGGE